MKSWKRGCFFLNTFLSPPLQFPCESRCYDAAPWWGEPAPNNRASKSEILMQTKIQSRGVCFLFLPSDFFLLFVCPVFLLFSIFLHLFFCFCFFCSPGLACRAASRAASTSTQPTLHPHPASSIQSTLAEIIYDKKTSCPVFINIGLLWNLILVICICTMNAVGWLVIARAVVTDLYLFQHPLTPTANIY